MGAGEQTLIQIVLQQRMNNRTVEMPNTARKTKQTDDLKHEKTFPFSLGCFLLNISVSENLSAIRSGAAIP
jgi:hypothetical protein